MRGNLMPKDLKTRKQEVVRDAIYYAALDLFIRNGYNETTIDQIVEAAGISQRSFFRYFATKDDLLGYSSLKRGDVLVAAVEGCPHDLAPLEVIRRAAAAGTEFAMTQPQTRQIIEITAANLPARQAHRGGMVEVEDQLSEAFARRTKSPSKFSLEPRLMALMTIMIADLTLATWFTGEAKDCSTAARNVFARLNRLYCRENSGLSPSAAKAGQRKQSAR
jgi:TetR/AcrR family transcriptional regulator, regulator of mycofactocin system